MTERLDLDAEVAAARRDPRRALGRYLLLSELGRGGMGVVHRAWDQSLKRVVALKVLARADDDPAAIQRFRREAEAVARLRHPGIVSVFDVGADGDRHFIAMDFIEGATLDRRLSERGPRRLALVRAIEVVRDVARAVQHAHERGVIHRDLKPQNVIVDAQGRASVLDFGLARVRDLGPRMTKTGATMGTPAYMPPEQAGGEGDGVARVDERSDVYSLGATLYHVLTGRPPFTGATNLAVITSVLTRDPVPPSRHNARAAGDLDTICLRCLDKDAARRYSSAGELAEELDRWLAGEPIRARPAGRVERLLRRARRNKAAAALALGGAVAVLGLGGTALAQAKARLDERAERERTEREREAAEREQAAEQARRDRETLRRQRGLLLAERARAALGDGRARSASVHAAQALTFEDTPAHRALLFAAREGLWRKPVVLADGLEGTPGHLSFAPDGRRLAVALADAGRVDVYEIPAAGDEPTGRRVASLERAGEQATGCEWRPGDGRLVLVGYRDGRTLRVWDVDEGRVVAERGPPAPAQRIGLAAWHPGGREIALEAGGEVALWDVATGHHRALPGRVGGVLYGLAWRPDGRLLAGAGSGGVFVWDPASGRLCAQIGGFRGSVFEVAWRSDGAALVARSADGRVRLFDVARVLEGDGGLLTDLLAGRATDGVRGLCWLDEHRVALAADDGSIRIWDTASDSLAILEARGGSATGMARSPDGATIATAWSDRRILLWNVAPAARDRLAVTRSVVASVDWRPDGSCFASGGHDGAVTLWSADLVPRARQGLGAWVSRLAWDPAGTRIAAATLRSPATGVPGAVHVLDGETLAPRVAPHRGESWALAVAWSPDGGAIASTWRDGRGLLLLDADSLAPLGERLPFGGEASAVAWSRDGAWVAVTSSENEVALVDARTREVFDLEPHRLAATALAFDPTSRLLATSGADRTIRLHDVRERRPVATLEAPARVDAIAFSGDGRRLASAGRDRQIRIWDIEARTELAAVPVVGAVVSLSWRSAPGLPDVILYAVAQQGGIVGTVPVDEVLGGPPAGQALEDAERGSGLRRLSEEELDGR